MNFSRIKNAILAGHVMTRKVVSVHEDAPLLKAAVRMRDKETLSQQISNSKHFLLIRTLLCNKGDIKIYHI